MSAGTLALAELDRHDRGRFRCGCAAGTAETHVPAMLRALMREGIWLPPREGFGKNHEEAEAIAETVESDSARRSYYRHQFAGRKKRPKQ